MSLTVIELIPNLATGGAREVFAQVVFHLRERGIRVMPVVIAGPPLVKEEKSFADRVHIEHFLGYDGRFVSISSYRRAASTLRRLVSRQNQAVLHSHLWPAASFGGKAAPGAPHVVHVHDTRPWISSHKIRSVLRRAYVRYNTRHCFFVSVSHAAKQYNAPITAGRENIVIHNAIKLKEFSGLIKTQNSSNVVFGAAARFSPEKGQRVLIHAFHSLISRLPNARLVFAGEGALRKDCEQLVMELGIAEYVSFLGQVTPIQSFLREIDVFVLPTLGCEGLPLTVLEAIAARRPVIASDVPGMKEAIVDDRHGQIVPTGDIPKLADEMFHMAANIEFYRSRINSSPLPKDWDAATSELVSVFEKCASR